MQLGYPLPKYGADGIFGDETLAAVNAFKKTASLPQNGIVDTATMLAIIDAVGAGKEQLEKNAQINSGMQTVKELVKVLELGTNAEKSITQIREKIKSVMALPGL